MLELQKKLYLIIMLRLGKLDQKLVRDQKSQIVKAFAEKNAKPVTPAGTLGGTSASTTVSTSATLSGTGTTKTSPAPIDTAAVNIPSFPGSIASILQEASAATGAPLGIMQRIAYSESGFNPNAKAKAPSSASGLFQFVKDTWDTMLRRKGKKYGLSPDTSPFDARANALMGGEFIQDNIKDIQSSVLTPPPTATDVYAAHFMGSDGAKQLFREIKNDPYTIAASVFPKAAESNPSIFYDKNKTPRTVRQVYEVLAYKMGTDPGPALAKAGTGLTFGEKAAGLAYKAGEKAKDIFGILTEWGSKIKDAFMDALTRQFTGEGIQKKLTDKKSEIKSLEVKKDKYAKVTSEQAQLDLAASKVSSTPHKIIENYVADKLTDNQKKEVLQSEHLAVGKPIPIQFFIEEAKRLGMLNSAGGPTVVSEAAGTQYGAVKSPIQTTANIKATSETMKKPTAETAKTDEVNKQEAAKKLAQLQSTIKPASQKGVLVGAGGSQSVPRASGNLGTSISGPIDDLLENLFNHMLLNDLNKIYPTSYAV